MLARIKRRLKDIGTLRQLLEKAERCARAEGTAEPGSEHLVMAALTLADGTARAAFHRVGADPARFAPSVTQQYSNALARLGVDAGTHLISSPGLPEQPQSAGVFKSKPSAQTLMATLARDRPFGATRPLLGADIVLAALSNDIGTVARALAVMGITPHRLADACRLEIAAQGSGQ